MHEVDAVKSDTQPLANTMGDQNQVVDWASLIITILLPRIFHFLLLFRSGFFGFVGFFVFVVLD